MDKLKYLLKRTDYLSEKINLTHKGAKSFQSWFGGFLTILIIFLSLGSLAFFSSELFDKQNPGSSLTTKYVSKAPNLTLGNKPGSTFIFIESINQPTQISLNSSYVNIIGHLIYNNNNSVIYEYGFSKCKYEEFLNVNADLFRDEMWKDPSRNYFCIDYIIQNNTKIYKNSTDYVDPFIINGHNTLLSTFTVFRVAVNKCVNSTLNNNSCVSLDEMNKLIYPNEPKLYFIDNYVNIANYTNPITSFINQITKIVFVKNIAQVQINYDAISLVTQDGIFFENYHTLNSHKYATSSSQITSPLQDNMPFVTYALATNNNVNLYTRNYVRMQTIAANTGGIIKLLMLLGQVLNFFYSKFEEKFVFFEEIFSDKINFNSQVSNLEVEKKNNDEKRIPVRAVSGFSLSQMGMIHNSNMYKLSQNKLDLYSHKISEKNLKIKEEENVSKKTKPTMNDNHISYLFSFCCKKKTYNNTKLYLDLTKTAKDKIFNVKMLITHYIDTEILKQVLFDKKKLQQFQSIKLNLSELTNTKQIELKSELNEENLNFEETIQKRLMFISQNK